MASFYIPMSLSYASNLGHIPPINGLYSFVFNPFIYALLGSCPQMVVGPEAAGSLLVGTVVRGSVDLGHSSDEDDVRHAIIAGVVTGMAGAMIFVAGLTRLGFLDSVLSRPFLRGFISAIGFVILVDQLIPEMGLSRRAKHDPGGASHGSSATKIMFLVTSVRYAHRLTCGVAFGSFAIIMVCRYVWGLVKYYDRFANKEQATEEIHAAASRVGGLRAGPLHRCRSVGGLDLEVWLGQARSRDPRNHPIEHWLTVSIPMAVPALQNDTHTRSHEYLVPYRAAWILRIFGSSQKFGNRRKQRTAGYVS